MGKQMEGDNRERRKKAKEARDEGRSASEDHASLGSSKQRHHLSDGDHEERLETIKEGKQGGAAQEDLPEGRPAGPTG